jgi:ribonuclease P protein component
VRAFRFTPLESSSIQGGDDIHKTSISDRKDVVKASSFLTGFTRRERLSRPQDFRRVMKLGRRLQSKNFILFIRENEAGFHRLGMVVKKEIGPATYRNRMKRYFREFFRLHKHQIRGSSDVIILAKKGCALNRYREAEAELRGLIII